MYCVAIAGEWAIQSCPLGVDRARKGQGAISQPAKRDDERFRNLFVGEHWAKVWLLKSAQKPIKMLFLRLKTQWKAERKQRHG
jgi:hypothetical protein